MTQNVNNNRLVLSSPTTSALSPYHHQSYLSQYKNHINYSDQSIQQQEEIGDPQANMNKYNNFAEYDPYQNNTIYYHPSSHFAHSHPSLNSLPPTTAAPAAFYVTNPDYYHQSYAMSPGAGIPATTALVQPMVAKIDAVIGATSIPLHPTQTLMNDPYVTPEQIKEDDFSNILAGVRKTCYSNWTFKCKSNINRGRDLIKHNRHGNSWCVVAIGFVFSHCRVFSNNFHIAAIDFSFSRSLRHVKYAELNLFAFLQIAINYCLGRARTSTLRFHILAQIHKHFVQTQSNNILRNFCLLFYNVAKDFFFSFFFFVCESYDLFETQNVSKWQ